MLSKAPGSYTFWERKQCLSFGCSVRNCPRYWAQILVPIHFVIESPLQNQTDKFHSPFNITLYKYFKMTVCILLPHLIFFFFLTKCLGLLNGSFCVLYSRSFMILVPLKLQLQFANVPIKVQCLKSDMYSACTTIISMFFIGLGGKINLQAPMLLQLPYTTIFWWGRFFSCFILQREEN